MNRHLAIIVIGSALGFTGCAATPAIDVEPIGIAGKAPEGEPVRYITGSRIPDRPPRDRYVRRIQKEDWLRDDQRSVITHADRPGN